jgi:chromosome segregation ATPase
MSSEDQPLGETEQQVLHLLEKWNGQRFSLRQLTEGSNVTPEMAERTLLSLKKRGLIDMKETEVSDESKQPSLENALFEIRELLERLSKLAARRESIKATVFERVRERLNEELSKAIANLEFAADRTHDRLLHLTKEIEEFKERIDEATVSHDIGEISREEADKRIQEFGSEITRLEAQRKEVLETRLEAHETGASKKRLSESKSRSLRDLLEELEIRKQVGEFEGREEAFKAEKNRILADLASLSGEHVPGSVLVVQVRSVVETAKALVDDKALVEEIHSRLNRACERINEMSSLAVSSHGK